MRTSLPHRSRAARIAAMLAVACLAYLACLASQGCRSAAPPSTGPSTGPSTAPAPMAAEVHAEPKAPPPAAATCVADPSWLSQPSLPSDVSDPNQLCAFNQFMWQSLLYLVQPTAPEPDSPLVFETWMPSYGIFVPAGAQPTPWGQQPPDPCAKGSKKLKRTAGSAPRVYAGALEQAGSEQPLMAPDGQFVWYSLSVNALEYAMLTSCELYRSGCAGQLKAGNTGGVDIIKDYPALAFPDGAIELKTSWKVLSEAEVASKSFYTVEGWIGGTQGKRSCQKAQLGMIGMHIVSKTAGFPAFLWATFEHRNNAPPCTDLAAAPPLGGKWNLFDPATCDHCTTNTFEPGKPAQVCRMHPFGDATLGTPPNGTGCEEDPNQFQCSEAQRTSQAANSLSLQQLNASVQALVGASTQIDSVWANYELVGNVWTRDKALPPYLQAQVGSLSAANTSMETYVQNGEAGQTPTNNCFSCHNQQDDQGDLPPAGLSHLFNGTADRSGGCPKKVLPAACAPYHTTGKPTGQPTGPTTGGPTTDTPASQGATP